MGRYAANIADLTRYDDLTRALLIQPALGKDPPTVRTSGDALDGGAVVLQVEPRRAAACILILQGIDRREKRYVLRAYVEGPRGGWSKATTEALERETA